jgi:hypothetical protein
MRRAHVLDSAQKKQYEQNHQNEPKPATGIIPPVLAVGPGGQSPHQKENENNQ